MPADSCDFHLGTTWRKVRTLIEDLEQKELGQRMSRVGFENVVCSNLGQEIGGENKVTYLASVVYL